MLALLKNGIMLFDMKRLFLSHAEKERLEQEHCHKENGKERDRLTLQKTSKNAASHSRTLANRKRASL